MYICTYVLQEVCMHFLPSLWKYSHWFQWEVLHVIFDKLKNFFPGHPHEICQKSHLLRISEWCLWASEDGWQTVAGEEGSSCQQWRSAHRPHCQGGEIGENYEIDESEYSFCVEKF